MTTRMIATAMRIQNMSGKRETIAAAEDWFVAVKFADQEVTCVWRTGVNAAPRTAKTKTKMIRATMFAGLTAPRSSVRMCCIASPPRRNPRSSLTCRGRYLCLPPGCHRNTTGRFPLGERAKKDRGPRESSPRIGERGSAGDADR